MIEMDLITNEGNSELPGHYRFLMMACIFVSLLGYIWDGFDQRKANKCLRQMEQKRQTAMGHFQRAMKSGNPIDKKLAAQYAGYLSQNTDQICDEL